jgi:hypothetical protein
VHRLEDVLMLPARDLSLFGSGANVLDGAARAGVGPGAAQDQSIFLARVVISGRRAVSHLVCQVILSC